MIRTALFATMISGVFSVACSGDDAGTPAGASGGAGGNPSAEGGAGGASECAEGDTGTIAVEVTGLPDGIDAAATLTGPDGDHEVVESGTDDGPTGGYSVVAERVADQDPIVRTLFEPTVSEGWFCLVDGETSEATVAYDAIAPSNKLWVMSEKLVGFASSELDDSGSPDATVAAEVSVGTDLAFDRDGNLWMFGGTSADAPLVRYPAASLGDSGEKEPDREITINDVACIPLFRGMAFDPDGNLWVSACGGDIMRLSSEMLEDSGDVTADVVISDVTENADIAFDADGNLWAVGDGKVLRYDADRLGESTSDAADATLSVRNADDDQDIGATFLTFDVDGDLWVTSFGGNFVAEIAAADLDASGEETVVSDVSLVLSVTALLNRPAFDDAGALWISYGAGSFVRLGPDLLSVTTTAGDPTSPDVIIESADVGYAGNVAFFPAAAGLPLYHAFP